MVFKGVRYPLRVEACYIEAAAAIPYRGEELRLGEAQGDLDVVGRAAVADGVGASLFYAEHGVVDQTWLGAVLAQVVAQTLASA